jgi:hypothetical protein
VSAGRITIDTERRARRAYRARQRVRTIPTPLADAAHRERLRVRMSQACEECMAAPGKPCRTGCRLTLSA